MTRRVPFKLSHTPEAELSMEVFVEGWQLLNHPLLNKGTAFSLEERLEFGLQGLLPARVSTLEQQVRRIWVNHKRNCEPLARYMDLMALMDRNETLFYGVLVQSLEELLPIIYTPTVGQACKEFGHIYRKGRGLYVTADDVERLDEILGNWPVDDVAVMVVTDGERILGLGDLGSGGMGIPIGKLSLYVGAGGIHPARTLPVCLDVGTDNEKLLEDPMYLGVRQRRLRGAEYDRLVERFLEAAHRRFPHVLFQFEDFATGNAIRLLDRYRDQYCCFNDDIQGTAAVVAAGVFAACQKTETRLQEQRFLMVGSGSSAFGIASLLVSALQEKGLSQEEARSRFWFIDSQGLVHDGRDQLSQHKQDFARTAQEADEMESEFGSLQLKAVAQAIRPTMVLGASAQPGLFDEELVRGIAQEVKQPTFFIISNPTSLAECTPEQAIEWSDGRALVATGSPFGPVEYQGETHRIGQANNVFIFPGLGLGILATHSRRIPDRLFLAAARALADQAPEDSLYPTIGKIRQVSRRVAAAVAKEAVRLGLTEEGLTVQDAVRRVDAEVWEPEYLEFRKG